MSRSFEPELMDDPALDPAELGRALDDLDAINRLLGGHAASVSGVERLLPRGAGAVSILDAGCGGGDTARALARWARARALDARICAADLSPHAIARARARGEDAAIEWRAADLHALEGSWDVVHAALLLHHSASDEAAAAMLRKLWSLARVGLVVNDLHRHPVAVASASAFGLLGAGRVARHDAPLSVRRAFTRAELEALAARAGLPKPEIEWRWAFRWRLVARR